MYEAVRSSRRNWPNWKGLNEYVSYRELSLSPRARGGMQRRPLTERKSRGDITTASDSPTTELESRIWLRWLRWLRWLPSTPSTLCLLSLPTEQSTTRNAGILMCAELHRYAFARALACYTEALFRTRPGSGARIRCYSSTEYECRCYGFDLSLHHHERRRKMKGVHVCSTTFPLSQSNVMSSR